MHQVERRLADLGYTPEHVEELVENEWLGLGDTYGLQVDNPWDARTPEDIESPHLFILGLMRQPEYFGFTCQHLFNKTIHPQQQVVLMELWKRTYPMLIGNRGFGKSFLIALYLMLRMTICQGAKVVIVGSAFRQSKVVFDYMDEIWQHAPLLRDICSDSRDNGPRRDIDRCTMRIGESFASAIPIGNGDKIRGLRASIIDVEEFASVNPDIFENVVSGFASVSLSPVEKVRSSARRRAMKRLGILDESEEGICIPGITSNQTILSGTAFWGFNHFYRYWLKHKAIVESRGDPKALEEIFHGDVPAKFDWKAYSVMRIPFDMLPEDYMDEQYVAKQQATIHTAQFLMEYGSCFVSDSNGFYRRSMIERCVVGKPGSPVVLPGHGEVRFAASLRGLPGRRYVMGVDPASESDNFSIVIVECWEDHRRIVFCWTTTRQRHKERYKKGLSEEQNFYVEAARKVRELAKLFPCERIAIDSQGGGVSILEALADTSRLGVGERAILPVINEGVEQDTDDLPGEHIIEIISFASAEWVSQANHGMRKDFESQCLLFPEFDSAELALAIEDDKLAGRVADGQRIYDSLEDCMMEIEELKEELATIVHTQTGVAMRDRWDTPQVRQPGGRLGRLRKDRYSALLMANMVGRQLAAPRAQSTHVSGGFARDIVLRRGERRARHHTNPEWYERMKVNGACVRRG
jgi:hypothetical protein